jgi:4-hydroxy-tetrahydrodipicolinate reductase
MKTRVIVAGATGWVGPSLMREIDRAEDLELVGAVSRKARDRTVGEILNDPRIDVRVSGSVVEALQVQTDVLVDYTLPDVVKDHVLQAIHRGVNVVIGASGLTDEDYLEIDALARKHQVGVIAAGNFAITAILMQRFATIAAKYVPQWEIIEYGEASKLDAPGSTARELAYFLSQVQKPIVERPIAATHGLKESRGATVNDSQIHSLRLPGYGLSAEIIFGAPSERLTIRHDADKSAIPYVAGTLLAVRKVKSLVGLVRGLGTLMD